MSRFVNGDQEVSQKMVLCVFPFEKAVEREPQEWDVSVRHWEFFHSLPPTVP